MRNGRVDSWSNIRRVRTAIGTYNNMEHNRKSCDVDSDYIVLTTTVVIVEARMVVMVVRNSKIIESRASTITKMLDLVVVVVTAVVIVAGAYPSLACQGRQPAWAF